MRLESAEHRQEKGEREPAGSLHGWEDSLAADRRRPNAL
jgi:hypothetical protein